MNIEAVKEYKAVFLYSTFCKIGTQMDAVNSP